jgi:site-specific DNA recombinase
VREEVIDGAVRGLLASIAIFERDHTAMQALIEKARGLSASEDEAKLRGLRLRRDEIESRLSRLTDAFVDGLIDESTFKARSKQLQKESVQIAAHLDQAEQSHRAYEQAAETLLRRL